LTRNSRDRTKFVRSRDCVSYIYIYIFLLYLLEKTYIANNTPTSLNYTYTYSVCLYLLNLISYRLFINLFSSLVLYPFFMKTYSDRIPSHNTYPLRRISPYPCYAQFCYGNRYLGQCAQSSHLAPYSLFLASPVLWLPGGPDGVQYMDTMLLAG